MPNKTDFEKVAGFLKDIKDDRLKFPTIPMDTYNQEAENLAVWCEPDKEKLIAAGLDWSIFDSMATRAGASRWATSLWFKVRFTQEQAQDEWKKLSPTGYELLSEILHSMRYAYSDNDNLLKRVSEIAEGRGNADMIQDLSDSAVLGQGNIEPLKAIGFDTAKLDEASRKSDELASLLAHATGEKALDSDVKLARDQAYTYLKEGVDAIRKCGQYVFWKNEKRAYGYASEYSRQARRASKAKATVPSA